jgi:Virulence-associated protein E
MSDTSIERGAAELDKRVRGRGSRRVPRATLDGGLLKDANGIVPCEHNAYVLIDTAPQYAGLFFDEFLTRLRIGERDWHDADDLECLRWLQSAHQVPRFSLAQARNGARSVAYSRRRDSLREFVERLPPWDGAPRIELALCDAWGAPDDALTRAGSRNFFLAMIARALQPGAKVDTLWTFEAPQGRLKSMSLHTLAGDFHAEISAPIGTTDFMREMCGLWIAELSELDSLRGREASTVKRLLSAPSDRFVQKYQLHAESYPRRAVAVATTNEATYWQDSTGARRLVPIACGDIRVDLIAANRLQWFSEARHLYAAGCTWWEFPTDIVEAQDQRQQVDPWEDSLRDMISNGRRCGIDGQGRVPWPRGWISSATIMHDWLRLEPHQQGQAVGRRLGAVMRRLGFRPKQLGKERERGWEPNTSHLGADEVSA